MDEEEIDIFTEETEDSPAPEEADGFQALGEPPAGSVIVDMNALVGGGYDDFWNCRKRYRVVKGSRANKKSRTCALWFIYHLMRCPDANLLVVRKTYRTLRDSCYAELKWAIQRMQVGHLWEARESPLELRYLPTGQRICFRGLDDPLKITSVSVSRGSLCWMWIEEAYEIDREGDFDTLDESIRGAVEAPLFKQITLTFNPWSGQHWLKSRFFDEERSDALAITTDYRCNEFLDESDLAVFRQMKERNPRRYAVAGLGEWGVPEGLVYENWRCSRFALLHAGETPKPGAEYCPLGRAETAAGLDFGFTNDPTALFIGFLDREKRQLWVWDELVERGLSDSRLAEAIRAKGYGKVRILADAAEPRTIDHLRELGLHVSAAKKGSILSGVQYLRDFEIIIHPRCKVFLQEIAAYAWAEDSFGHRLNTPTDKDNHLMDAMRYAIPGAPEGK